MLRSKGFCNKLQGIYASTRSISGGLPIKLSGGMLELRPGAHLKSINARVRIHARKQFNNRAIPLVVSKLIGAAAVLLPSYHHVLRTKHVRTAMQRPSLPQSPDPSGNSSTGMRCLESLLAQRGRWAHKSRRPCPRVLAWRPSSRWRKASGQVDDFG